MSGKLQRDIVQHFLRGITERCDDGRGDEIYGGLPIRAHEEEAAPAEDGGDDGEEEEGGDVRERRRETVAERLNERDRNEEAVDAEEDGPCDEEVAEGDAHGGSIVVKS